MKTLSLSVLLLAGGCALAQAPSPSNSTLEQKVAAVLPTTVEDRWTQIPWRANLMEARADAEREGKPLFLWIMDGNPLACG